MTNKEFDLWLRETLSSVQPEFNPGDWDHFVQRVEESESLLDSGFDDAIRSSVTGVGSEATPDWERMEQQLNADESGFDQHVRQTIENFEVPYNSTTWPTLHARLSEDERIRRRLVHVKILEIVGVLIVFLTFYNFFPALKSSVIDPTEDLLRKELSKESPLNQPITALPSDHAVPYTSSDTEANQESLDSERRTVTSDVVSMTRDANFTESFIPEDLPDASRAAGNEIPTDINSELAGSTLESGLFSVSDNFPGSTSDNTAVSVHGKLAEAHVTRTGIDELQSLKSISQLEVMRADALPGFIPVAALVPTLIKPAKVRFGMMAAADVNTLFFPKEHFYSQGRSINFSEKEIVAGGYSTGASLLFDFKKIIVETGLSYSTKTFGPDRKLFIGSSSDRHTLDFENITLNTISVPLYVHWKLDGKGAWRVYATSGASMHVIANAHYDLLAENIFTSSIVQDPQQLQNEKEVQRVREHMLDGAKFNSNGYVTVAGGFGVERFVNSRMSIFAQPMYQYQIQFFGLFDRQGKHLQNGSLLFGTRISL
jgi:hypothetical protein